MKIPQFRALLSRGVSYVADKCGVIVTKSQVTDRCMRVGDALNAMQHSNGSGQLKTQNIKEALETVLPSRSVPEIITDINKAAEIYVKNSIRTTKAKALEDLSQCKAALLPRPRPNLFRRSAIYFPPKALNDKASASGIFTHELDHHLMSQRPQLKLAQPFVLPLFLFPKFRRLISFMQKGGDLLQRRIYSMESTKICASAGSKIDADRSTMKALKSLPLSGSTGSSASEPLTLRGIIKAALKEDDSKKLSRKTKLKALKAILESERRAYHIGGLTERRLAKTSATQLNFQETRTLQLEEAMKTIQEMLNEIAAKGKKSANIFAAVRTG